MYIGNIIQYIVAKIVVIFFLFLFMYQIFYGEHFHTYNSILYARKNIIKIPQTIIYTLFLPRKILSTLNFYTRT